MPTETVGSVRQMICVQGVCVCGCVCVSIHMLELSFFFFFFLSVFLFVPRVLSVFFTTSVLAGLSAD